MDNLRICCIEDFCNAETFISSILVFIRDLKDPDYKILVIWVSIEEENVLLDVNFINLMVEKNILKKALEVHLEKEKDLVFIVINRIKN